MKSVFNTKLHALIDAGQEALLGDGLTGIEKESLRLSKDGRIAQTPHPSRFGSALTHPWITTDYSEALIELITPPCGEAEETLGFLNDLHRFVHEHLDQEVLLASSMPIGLAGDESIPIAQYGSSNIGQMKHIYRKGLAYRYGRTMQSIAGVHFNYSVNEQLWPVFKELRKVEDPLPRFISESYFEVIRNIHRHGWILIYLFGNSPAIGKSFFTGRESLGTSYPELDKDTYYKPYATSLRMSDIGFRNDNQTSLDISLNDLGDYVRDLESAMNQPYPPYEGIGLVVDGEYRQLSTNILQIENEYYSVIRPKQVALSGERPTIALRKRGVRYLELRALDLNSFSPSGITIESIRFIETFVLMCLLTESPMFDTDEKVETSQNSLSVACCGRTPGIHLLRHGNTIALKEWANQILDAMVEIAELLDTRLDLGTTYRDAVEAQRAGVNDPELTLSARVLREMREQGLSFEAYALKLSEEHADYWKKHALTDRKRSVLAEEADSSWRQQRKVEQSDLLDFDTYLKRYMEKR